VMLTILDWLLIAGVVISAFVAVLIAWGYL
jgi:hypothetical protein